MRNLLIPPHYKMSALQTNMRLEVYFLKNVIDQNVCIFCQKTTIMKKIVLKNFEKKIKKERKNILKKM